MAKAPPPTFAIAAPSSGRGAGGGGYTAVPGEVRAAAARGNSKTGSAPWAQALSHVHGRHRAHRGPGPIRATQMDAGSGVRVT